MADSDSSAVEVSSLVRSRMCSWALRPRPASSTVTAANAGSTVQATSTSAGSSKTSNVTKTTIVIT